MQIIPCVIHQEVFCATSSRTTAFYLQWRNQGCPFLYEAVLIPMTTILQHPFLTQINETMPTVLPNVDSAYEYRGSVRGGSNVLSSLLRIFLLQIIRMLGSNGVNTFNLLRILFLHSIIFCNFVRVIFFDDKES